MACTSRALLALVLTAALAPLPAARAVPVDAFIDSCPAGGPCVIKPTGGRVPVDHTGFELELDWSPEHVELIEPADDRGEWLLDLIFDVTFTGPPGEDLDGVDDMADVDLLEMGGVVITDLNPSFDDVNHFAPEFRARYEIFGPDTLGTFFVHGLTLDESDFEPLPEFTVTSMAFARAVFTARSGDLAAGVWVPEPGPVGLLALGLTGLLVGRGLCGSASRSQGAA